MKILRAIIFGLVLGVTAGVVIVTYAEYRSNTNTQIFMQGRVSGFNECQKEKQRTGVLMPQGATELTELWQIDESL